MYLAINRCFLEASRRRGKCSLLILTAASCLRSMTDLGDFLRASFFFLSSSDSSFFCFVSCGFLARISLLLSQPLTELTLGHSKIGTLVSHASNISSTPFRLLEFATPFSYCSSKISFIIGSRTLTVLQVTKP